MDTKRVKEIIDGKCHEFTYKYKDGKTKKEWFKGKCDTEKKKDAKGKDVDAFKELEVRYYNKEKCD